MQNYSVIEQKINQYIRKYYINELIKGIILFFSATLLYFILTTALEFFLWFNSLGRAVLFWSFIVFSSILFAKFIFWPIAKLLRWTKGIDHNDASSQIGKHFPEVSDKLTNLLQLKSQGKNDDLVIAGIEQKANDLKPVPFQLAIDLSSNLKYAKYAIIPISIILLILAFGRFDLFSSSYQRVLNYQTYFEPPAPFYFQLSNTDLNIEEGQSLDIEVLTAGNVIPKQAKIHFNNQSYFLKPKSNGIFSYTIENISEDTDFNFSANGIISNTYHVDVINVPKILDFSLKLDYPTYTQKQDKTLQGQGSLSVPEGTTIKWQLKTQSTDSVHFKTKENYQNFEKKGDLFSLNKNILNSLNYTISTSNQNLKHYENLSYHIKVIKDQYPKIKIEQQKDSLSNGVDFHYAKLSDDYGLKQSQLVFYKQDNPEDKNIINIPINNSTYDQFYYVFPNDDLELQEGHTYQYYFQVYDNDAVKGPKASQSQVFGYREKTQSEIDYDLLKQQNRSIDSLNTGLEKLKSQDKDLKAIEKLQKEKQKFNYSDKQKVSNFIKRQKQQRQMMKAYMKSLKESLSDFQPNEKSEEKQALKERIDNNEKKLQEHEQLLDELEKYQNKIDNEKLKEKLDQFSKKSQQQERSLEQLLELTKRYYIEQKLQKLTESLNDLSEKQEALSEKSEIKESKQQDKLNKEFKAIKKQLDQLSKENKKLKEPMAVNRDELAEKMTELAQDKAQKSLEKSEAESTTSQSQQEQQKANQQQKKAADQMKKMSQQMSKSMMSMSAQQQQEDAEMLKKILDNLIIFSKAQESLMNDFKTMDSSNPFFPKKLRRQGQLRENFEHIDDSLFALALRNPMISDQITSKLTDIQYDMDKSIERLAETEMRLGTTSQQYVMVNANELANMLDNSLDRMQMQMNASGKGSGRSGKPKEGQSQGKGFQLSDIIKSHEDLAKKMGKGQKPGKNGKTNDQEGGNKRSKNGKSTKNGNSDQKTNQDSKSGQNKSEGQKGNGSKTGKVNESKNKQNNGLSDKMSQEIFEIYKQQQQLRDQLEDKIKELGLEGDSQQLEKSLDQLEEDLLMQGFSSDVLKQMKNIKHQLLKLDKAAQQQGQDNKREAQTNYKDFQNKTPIQNEEAVKEYFKSFELLNRQQLPLQNKYKSLINAYFNESQN